MPANPNSLKVTEAYRGRMVGIRDRAKHQAQKTWGKVKLEDLDRTYDPGLLAIRVAMMQREAAELSAGYLGAFIASETGKKIPLPTAVALQAGQARSGENLRKAFQNPLIGVKVDIKDGMDPAQALRKGGSRLIRQAGLATDEAAREALRLAMDDAPQVEGWKRAVKGTCGACAGMAEGSMLPAGTPLEIHPDCQCVSEPVVTRKGQSEIPPLRVLERAGSPGRPGEYLYSKAEHGTANATFGSEADEVLTQLSNRHLWPETEPIPLRPVGGAKSPRFVYRQQSGTPVEIRVPQSLPADEVGTTIAHETGHYLDRLLGPAKSKYVDFDDLSSSVVPRGGTPLQKAMRSFLKVADKSPTMQGDIPAALKGGGEVWARAYAQWITKAGPKPDAKTWGRVYFWGEEEFKPIGKALEGVLKAAKLL